MTNATMIDIPSHVEIDVRRPDGSVETVRPMNPVTGVEFRFLRDKDFAAMAAATKAAGRGDLLTYRNVTRQVPAAQPTAADLAEEDYIRRTNRIYAASAGGEAHDRIGGRPDIDRTPAHPRDY